VLQLTYLVLDFFFPFDSLLNIESKCCSSAVFACFYIGSSGLLLTYEPPITMVDLKSWSFDLTLRMKSLPAVYSLACV
jgi:hypothetical protein